MSKNNTIFNVSPASAYTYNNITSSKTASPANQADSLAAPLNKRNTEMTSSFVTSSSSSMLNQNKVINQNEIITNCQSVEIQAQFEVVIELSRFINIDLFQRGYYQIRLRTQYNKLIPTKVIVQLENNANNQNLSGLFCLV